MFTSEQKKILALSSLGGALEFYDFIVFIFLAKILGELFFPAASAIASLMGALAVFAIGYLARPLGGIIFGHFGDKSGRKKTFVATVFLMAIPTFLIGLLPTYHHIGILAPCLLIILRLLQGFSVGGEIPGAVVFSVETIMINNRCFATGLIFFGINTGMLAGSFFSSLLLHGLNSQQLMSWGWRLPFLLGGALGLLSYYLRKRLQETPIFKQLEKKEAHAHLPITTVFRHHPSKLFQSIILTAMQAIIISTFYLYMPTYLASFFHFPLDKLLALTTVNILLLMLPVLAISYWSDKIGRKKIIMVGTLFFCIFPYPLFSLFQHNDFHLVIFVALLCTLFAGCIMGCFSCMMAELFPTHVRYSGVAISYNVGFGIVGGLTPLIVTSLIHWTNNSLAPSWFLMAIAIVSFITLLFVRETYRAPL
jgi:MFS family permease